MNPLRGEAPLVVGDATYTLVLDVNAYCAVEAVLDRDTDSIAAAAVAQAGGNGVNLNLWRGMLWGALQQRHPCSMSDAGDIFGAAGVVAVKRALMQAMQMSFGLREAEDGDQSNPPMTGAAGTG